MPTWALYYRREMCHAFGGEISPSTIPSIWSQTTSPGSSWLNRYVDVHSFLVCSFASSLYPAISVFVSERREPLSTWHKVRTGHDKASMTSGPSIDSGSSIHKTKKGAPTNLLTSVLRTGPRTVYYRMCIHGVLP